VARAQDNGRLTQRRVHRVSIGVLDEGDAATLGIVTDQRAHGTRIGHRIA
jgi:hypothetical protein